MIEASDLLDSFRTGLSYDQIARRHGCTREIVKLGVRRLLVSLQARDAAHAVAIVARAQALADERAVLPDPGRPPDYGGARELLELIRPPINRGQPPPPIGQLAARLGVSESVIVADLWELLATGRLYRTPASHRLRTTSPKK